MRVAYTTFGEPARSGIPWTPGGGVQRMQRPPRAVAFMMTCYPNPAQAFPSPLQHLLVRGLDRLQSAGVVGGPGDDHWICDWDFLETPTLYGTWIPLPPNVETLAILDGGAPGCVGAITRGTITWLLAGPNDPWSN